MKYFFFLMCILISFTTQAMEESPDPEVQGLLTSIEVPESDGDGTFTVVANFDPKKTGSLWEYIEYRAVDSGGELSYSVLQTVNYSSSDPTQKSITVRDLSPGVYEIQVVRKSSGANKPLLELQSLVATVTVEPAVN